MCNLCFAGIRAVPMYLYTLLKNVDGLENIFFYLVVDPQLRSETGGNHDPPQYGYGYASTSYGGYASLS